MMYYFTESKWYGPLRDSNIIGLSTLSVELHDWVVASLPSGPIATELSKWAGQVKEEGKDFVFKWAVEASSYQGESCTYFNTQKEADDKYNEWSHYDGQLQCKTLEPVLTAVPIKDHQKQMITEIMDADQRDGLYTDADLISINPDYKEGERQTFTREDMVAWSKWAISNYDRTDLYELSHDELLTEITNMKDKNWIEYEARIREDERERVLDEMEDKIQRFGPMTLTVDTMIFLKLFLPSFRKVPPKE